MNGIMLFCNKRKSFIDLDVCAIHCVCTHVCKKSNEIYESKSHNLFQKVKLKEFFRVTESAGLASVMKYTVATAGHKCYDRKE